MPKRPKHIWGRLGVLLLCGAFSACSSLTPFPSSRRGLFEIMSGLREMPDPRGDAFLSRDPSFLKSASRGTKDWQWPLKNIKITSPFGRRGSHQHEGLDLRAKVGTPVYAVQTGKVVYAGAKIRGYGKMVVIKHGGDLFSVYAHHSRNLVKKGQWVKRGQKIALSGKTGRARGPHLHFEVRKGSVPLDPQKLL